MTWGIRIGRTMFPLRTHDGFRVKSLIESADKITGDRSRRRSESTRQCRSWTRSRARGSKSHPLLLSVGAQKGMTWNPKPTSSGLPPFESSFLLGTSYISFFFFAILSGFTGNQNSQGWELGAGSYLSSWLAWVLLPDLRPSRIHISHELSLYPGA